MTEQEIKQIIQENKETLDDIKKRIRRIEKNFVWSSIFGFIKIIIILAPIIFGIIYFTPFVKDFARIYESVLKNLPITLQNFNKTSDETMVSDQTSQGLEDFCDPQIRQTMVDNLCK